MAENPAYWRPLEHAISAAMNRHHMLTGFDHSGRTLESRIAIALFRQGLVTRRNIEKTEAVCRATLIHIRNREAEHPEFRGLGHEAELAHVLRDAKLVEERAEEETGDGDEQA